VSGREFTRADDERRALVAIVNETMAAQFWRGRNPIGERVQVKDRWMQVVGVAKDSKYRSVRETATPFFYVPLRQNFSVSAAVFIRTPLSPETVAVTLAARYTRWTQPCPVRTYHPARATGSLDIAATRGRNFGERLRCLGAAARCHRIVRGDVICSVAKLTRTRTANGAWSRCFESGAAGAIARLSVSRRRALLGVVVALALTRLLGRLLYNVSPRDPLTFGAPSQS